MSGILVIRLQGLGDIIHLIPSLRMLRDKFPEEKIALLCRKGFGSIVPAEYNIKIIEISAHANISEMFRLIKAIRKEKFAKLFDLFGNPRTAILSLFSGVKERFGFNYRFRKYAYKSTYAPTNQNKHLMALFADFFAHFGIEGKVYYPEIKMPEDVIKKATNSISDFSWKKPLLAINPNSVCQSRSWPKEHIITFINQWYEKTSCPVLLTWGPGEKEYTESLISEIGSEKAFTHKPVKINEFMALLGSLNLFLTSDTGPMNIAWAAGTPTIALYGATTSEPTAPRGARHMLLIAENVSCLRCHKDFCSHKKCMYNLTPDYVLKRILDKYDLTNTRAVK